MPVNIGPVVKIDECPLMPQMDEQGRVVYSPDVEALLCAAENVLLHEVTDDIDWSVVSMRRFRELQQALAKCRGWMKDMVK